MRIRRRRAGALALAARVAGVEELALELVQRRVVGVAPLERLGQPAAAEQRALVAVQPAPLLRGGGDAAMDAQALAVLLDPAAQPRPLAQQRLVRDLDAARVTVSRRRSVSSSTTRATSSPRSVSSSASGTRRRSTAPPGPSAASRTRMLRAIGLLRRVEPAVRVLGEPRDRAAHAAGALVRRVAQAPPVALLPQLEERGREQRERARLALDVLHERVGELGLDAQADALRRRSIAWRSSSRRIERDEHVVGGEQRESSG